MNFNLIQIVGHMGVFDKAIFITLAVMALLSLVVFFERLIAFRRTRSTNRTFAMEAAQLLGRGHLDALLKKAEGARGSHLAQLLSSGLKVFLPQVARGGGKVSPVELTRRELARQSEAVNADVRRGLAILASVGSVAPFVGLLGTVMGIINSFQSIAKEGSGGLGTVSAGISEALIVTAAGLVVAIPAVLAFNVLTSQADAIMLALDQSRGEFLDHLENGAATTCAQDDASKANSAVATGREFADARPV